MNSLFSLISLLSWISSVRCAPQGASPSPAPAATCNCTGTTSSGANSSGANVYICGDRRLGPVQLPTAIPLSGLVSDYDRFGGEQQPGGFLARWTDAQGAYIYPPKNGFQLDKTGDPILGNMTLQPGTRVDRFGSQYGSYISAADAPYSQRALPPSNLDTDPNTPDYPYNYHVYQVLKPLPVVGGPIAPWFGQPGLGAQFYTGGVGNMLNLTRDGYLVELNKTGILVGAQGNGGCG